jgi:hypothetical protein
MITAEQISDNFKTFQTLVKETFKGDPRLPNIESIVETWEERFTLAPASSKDWYNNAFPGGYLDHVLRVHKIANQQYKLYQYHNCPINYTENELNFVALFCQLGKLGDVDNEYFQKNDSDWHVKNMGMVYKFNPDIAAMKIYDRTFYLLQKANIPITQNEYLAIRNQEGLFDESNKFYFYSGQKETRFRNHLPLLIHHSIQIAQEIEFEIWNSKSNPSPQPSFKPANATKADKNIRKSKAINTEVHPQFSEKTKSIIDSFFNSDEE